MTYNPVELAGALGLPPPTDEQAAVIAAPPGPLVVVAGAGAGKTETMAARVVWLVANGYAHPGQVLGLTFTRKAAGQLLRRVRSRLARLSGHLGETLDTATATPLVSTYHAFAGSLLREFGLLLPVEPDARLLSETERWQLAFEVINAHPDALPLDKTPAAVTAMVLRLSDELAEHLVDTAALTDTHRELDRLVHHLPAGPRQRGDGPNRRLLDMLDTQTDRAALVPLLRHQALSWALGQASAAEIDRHGIRFATEAAMTRALQRLSITPELVLVDGVLPLRGWSGPQRTVIKGDLHCAAISAASVMAKQERDALLRRLADHFPGYGLERHAGYGTSQHRQALASLGATPLHRQSFLH
jgi:ribonuclease HII